MELAQFYKALSETTRLRVLALILAYKEVCVCDLVAVLDIPQGSVSRHLSYLKKSGIVESKTRGTWRFYQINPDLDNGLREILTSTFAVISKEAQVQNDISKFNPSTC